MPETKATHTPRKLWRKLPGLDPDGTRGFGIIRSVGHKTVCFVIDEKDADIIEAAPEIAAQRDQLLLACKMVAEECADPDKSGRWLERFITEGTISHIVAAIAAAEPKETQ